MNRDYKGNGHEIKDEPVEFINTEDDASGQVGMLALLEHSPAVHTVKLYSAILLGGTGYTVQTEGTVPDADKVLIVDEDRGLLRAGDSVPANLFATYTSVYGTPIRAHEMNQIQSQGETFPIIGRPDDGEMIIPGAQWESKTRLIRPVIVVKNVPTTGDATFWLMSDEIGTTKLIITIPQNANRSLPVSGFLDIPVTGGLHLLAVTMNNCGAGYLRVNKTTTRLLGD